MELHPKAPAVWRGRRLDTGLVTCVTELHRSIAYGQGDHAYFLVRHAYRLIRMGYYGPGKEISVDPKIVLDMSRK